MRAITEGDSRTLGLSKIKFSNLDVAVIKDP